MKNNNTQSEYTWHLIDAKDQVLGRLCTQVVDQLRGKNEVTFANNTVSKNKVVIINCQNIKVTGQKEVAKTYYHHSGFPGGIKAVNLKDLREKDATLILKSAIKGMLPKNKLQSIFLQNLYLYNGSDHPHTNIKFN